MVPNVSEEDKCKYITKNLFRMIDNPSQSTLSSDFLRELLTESPQCDAFNQEKLVPVRSSYGQYLKKIETNPGTVERIKSITGTNHLHVMKKKAGAAIQHHESWTHDTILSCLSPWNKFNYYIFEKAENTFAFFGTLLPGRYVEQSGRALMLASRDAIKKQTTNE